MLKKANTFFSVVTKKSQRVPSHSIGKRRIWVAEKDRSSFFHSQIIQYDESQPLFEYESPNYFFLYLWLETTDVETCSIYQKVIQLISEWFHIERFFLVSCPGHPILYTNVVVDKNTRDLLVKTIYPNQQLNMTTLYHSGKAPHPLVLAISGGAATQWFSTGEKKELIVEELLCTCRIFTPEQERTPTPFLKKGLDARRQWLTTLSELPKRDQKVSKPTFTLEAQKDSNLFSCIEEVLMQTKLFPGPQIPIRTILANRSTRDYKVVIQSTSVRVSVFYFYKTEKKIIEEATGKEGCIPPSVMDILWPKKGETKNPLAHEKRMEKWLSTRFCHKWSKAWLEELDHPGSFENQLVQINAESTDFLIRSTKRQKKE